MSAGVPLQGQEAAGFDHQPRYQDIAFSRDICAELAAFEAVVGEQASRFGKPSV